MKSKVYIEKRFISDNGKIFRIGDKIKCIVYDNVLEENCNYEGIVIDIFDNYFILKNCKINEISILSDMNIPYHSIKENSCYFIL